MTPTALTVPRRGRATPGHHPSGRGSASRVQARAALLFLLPALLFLAAFVAYPLLTAGVLSFHEWDGASPRVFNGLDNWRRLLGDDIFWHSLRNNVVIAVVAVVFQVLLALVISYWLVRLVPRIKRFAMFIYVVPVVISEICIALLWSFVYNPQFGLLNGFLRTVGLDGLTHGWLGDRATALPAVLVVMNLTYMGLYVLLFVAAFQNVDESVYEAATLDGAGHIRTFFSVSVPMIWNDLQSTTLLAVVSSFKTFSLVYVLTKGGPNNETEVVSTYLFQTGFNNFESGYASTIGFAQIVLTAVVGIVIIGLMRRRRDGGMA